MSNATSPAEVSARGVSASTMSTGWSRYSKIRSKSASDVCTSSPTPSSDPTGKNNRVCSVVNETSVGTVSDVDQPCAIASPPNQYAAAGITAKLVWIVAIIQRPAIRCLHLELGEAAGLALEPVGKLLRAPHRLAEQDPRDR